MTFLLIVYLFLNDGRIVKENYPHVATTAEDCATAGHEKQKALKKEFPDSTSAMFLCIKE